MAEQHVYIVARAERRTGAALTAYSDALSALADARAIAAENRWVEDRDHPPGYGRCNHCGQSENPGELYRAAGDHADEWIAVSQQRVHVAPAFRQKVIVGTGDGASDAAVAGAVTRFLDWQRRA